MSGLAILFLLLNAVALLMLARRWAPLPLLVGACYMTFGQQVLIGPFHFTVIRVLIFVGLLRVLARGERPAGGFVGLDWLMLAWGVWAFFSSAFHKAPGDYLIGQLGLVYNTLGVYFLIRAFCASLEDVAHLVKITGLLLAPVAAEMILEQLTGRNLFSVFGAVPEVVTVAGIDYVLKGRLLMESWPEPWGPRACP